MGGAGKVNGLAPVGPRGVCAHQIALLHASRAVRHSEYPDDFHRALLRSDALWPTSVLAPLGRVELPVELGQHLLGRVGEIAAHDPVIIPPIGEEYRFHPLAFVLPESEDDLTVSIVAQPPREVRRSVGLADIGQPL